MSKTWVVFVCALVCCFLWGSAFPCIKIGYSLFSIGASDSASQIVFAGTRFTLAGILVILFGSLIGRKPLVPARTSLHMVVKLALVQTVAQYIFFYIGLAHTSGVKSSIIGASNVFLSILVAVVVFQMEKLTAKKVIGCIAGFAGVVIINLSSGSLDMNLSFLGEGFIFLSAVSYAFSSALIKRYSENENPVTLSGYQFLCGGILLTGFGLAMGGRISLAGAGLPALGLLLYMAFISAAAYTLWGILLKYNPVARVAVFGFMNPVFGVLLSALFLGESSQAFGLTGVAALLLVCVGIMIVNGSAGTAKERSQDELESV
ncbi:DMT family transporter [Eisenbergiella porci]|uniref:DMT family transporter n=1 Tax=Eisenbergiella porci TaxID=2652274 RepID=UPI002A8357DA|nr:DMT family transporter [Eisenbergiella porci]